MVVRLEQRIRGAVRDLRGYPRQYWILVGGTFVYVAAAALGFPYEGIFLRRTLGMSMTWIGILFGVVPLAVMPLQVWGGSLTDRLGRRRMIILAGLSAVVWFAGFAFVRSIWQVAVLVALESAFGWPLFQTASGAMIADLLPPEQRAEAFSISRVALNAGVVAGPALGGLALGFGLSFRQLFLIAAAGCFVFMVLTIVGVRETRPAAAALADEQQGRAGYGVVRADTRFLAFCGVALLPVFCFGTFGAMYSIFITDVLGVPYGTWGLLLALNAFMVAVVQYPLIRSLRDADRLVLLSMSSALVGLGLGLSAVVHAIWPLIIMVVILSFGEILLSPIATTVVSDMAPEAVRGRYMGVWTVVWNGGASLGPALSGVAMDVIGGRETFLVVLAVGLAGAVGFLLLRARVHSLSGPPDRAKAAVTEAPARVDSEAEPPSEAGAGSSTAAEGEPPTEAEGRPLTGAPTS